MPTDKLSEILKRNKSADVAVLARALGGIEALLTSVDMLGDFPGREPGEAFTVASTSVKLRRVNFVDVEVVREVIATALKEAYSAN